MRQWTVEVCNHPIAMLSGREFVNRPTRIVAVDRDGHLLTFTGTARVFHGEEAAMQAIMDGHVGEGDVVVVRYEGPKGGPGMREMLKTRQLGKRRCGDGAVAPRPGSLAIARLG